MPIKCSSDPELIGFPDPDPEIKIMGPRTDPKEIFTDQEVTGTLLFRPVGLLIFVKISKFYHVTQSF